MAQDLTFSVPYPRAFAVVSICPFDRFTLSNTIKPLLLNDPTPPAMNSKLALFLVLVAICFVSVVEGQYYSPYYSSYGYGYSPYYGYGGYGYGGYGYGGYYGGYPSYYGGYYGKREAGFAPKAN